MTGNVFEGWNNPEYRWYYLGTTAPLGMGLFLLTNSPDLTIVAILGMTVIWFVADLAT